MIDPIEDILSRAVNEDFYVSIYGALPGGLSSFDHYVSVGWREGRDPNPWFSTKAYLETHPDVADAGIVPLIHFLQTGADEGRSATPSEHARGYYLKGLNAAVGATANIVCDFPFEDETMAAQWSITRHEFDYRFYLAVNEDVAVAGIDPLLHYLTQGWNEGRDPTPFFGTRDYLEANPDVAEAGVNPFYHYLVAGRSEGRPVRIEVGVRHKVIANIRTIEERIAACPRLPASRVGTQDALNGQLTALTRSGCRKLFISVSHDDFTANVGGLQFCLLREAEALERGGIDHVHLFPADPLLVTNREDPNPPVGVLVNGNMAGYFRANAVGSALGAFLGKNAWRHRAFAVHSMLGHNAASLISILQSAGLLRGFFWLHDYASVCAGLNLLRNDVEYCHAPSPESPACSLCVYGDRRRVQAADHAALFETFETTVVAPSHAALSVWRSATQATVAREIVHSHCQMIPRESDEAAVHNGVAGEQMRIAFLGYRGTHKGWPIYRELALRFSRDRRYAFYHLGKLPEVGLPVAFREVSVGLDSQRAMVGAVEELRIDVAIIWSLWPETFCFTAHEAIAGGAILLAPPGSGNIPSLIEKSGRGRIVPNEAELERLFDSGDIRPIVRKARPRSLFTLEYSDMTADLLGSEFS